MGNTSSITIEVDPNPGLAGIKSIDSEFAQLAKSMDAQNARLGQTLSDAISKMGSSLRTVRPISEQTFNNIEAGALRARESAALLGEEFGVKIPRALRGTIAEASLIGPIFSAAFSGLALFGFIDIAIHAVEQVGKLIEKFFGHEEQAKKTREAQAELNKIIAEGTDNVGKLQEAYHLIGLEGLPRVAEEQKLATEKFDAAKKSVADLTSRLQIMKDEFAKNSAQVGVPWGIEALTTGPAAAVQGLHGAKERIAELTTELAKAKVELTLLGQETENAGKNFTTTFSKQHVDGIREIAAAAQEALTKVQAMTAEANKSGATPEQQINIELRTRQELLAHILTLYGDDARVRDQVAVASVAEEKSASRQRIKILEDEANKKLESIRQSGEQQLADQHALDEKLRRMEDETLTIERQAAVASAAPWDRANASIVAGYQERIARIQQMEATGDLNETHAARQRAAAWNEAFAQTRDNLASQMQGLFDDITSGNIGKTFKKMFEQMVFHMVATWILGMQGMRAASQSAMGSGGGILGSLFGIGGGGGLFGGGSGGGSNASLISSFGGLAALPLLSGGASGDFASGGIPMLGLGLSAGQGAALPGIALPSGAGSGAAAGLAGGAGGFLSKLLTSSGFTQLALAGGAGLLLKSISLGGGLKGGLSGAAGGALIGTVIPGIGTLLGAGIGALVGLIAGLFGEHKGDKARKEVMEPLMAQIKVIKDSYDVFQTDYNSGVGQLEALRAQSIASINQIGGRQVGGNTRSTNKLVDDAESYMKTTEAERARRAQLQFGPAQFETGGFVGAGLSRGIPFGFHPAMAFASGGAVPAIVHEGEYVLQRSAVNHIGRGNLDRMNAGGGAGGDVHVHVHVLDTQSFTEYLRGGGLKAIAGEVHLAQVEGRW